MAILTGGLCKRGVCKGCIDFRSGGGLGERECVALAGAVKSANGTAVEHKVNAPPLGLVANDVPIFHQEARVVGEREGAIA
jgi:hypothetical protein